MAKQKEIQETLPGIPAAPNQQLMWRANFQYQGPNYALRAGSLILPANNIDAARLLANGTLKDLHGDKWFNVTKIVSINSEDIPF